MKLYAPSRISRRLGERFFFKAERDSTAKSAEVRRSYPPGMHGKKRRRAASEFGAELQEKQKIRYIYGLSDGQLKKYAASASRAKGKTKTQALLETLELRLDNVIYRLGFAPSRRIARHLAAYGHFLLNTKPVKTPSLLVQAGDVITIRPPSRTKPMFEGLAIRLKKYQPPEWLAVNPEDFSGRVLRRPAEEDRLISQNLNKVLEFYSR